jgi:ubiquinone/menaquinone biosynthesis C-methylase UbiE
MDVKEHKESFEAIYRGCSFKTDHLKFPLSEIDKFEWNRGPWGNEYYSYYYRRFTCHILSRLDVKEGHRVLVVGCGAGSEEKNIKTLYPNTEVWSIDISEEMIRQAVANQSPSHFAVSLAEALPFKDDLFDRLVSREVIEHVIDPQKMLDEISRVLKPEGIAVITTENEESFSPKNFYVIHIRSRLAKLLDYPLSEPPYKDKAPKLSEMKNYVRNAGLDLVEYFWDGALYKSLLYLRRFIKFKVSRLAHWLSCLENNRVLAYWFCDQVKYILRNPRASLAVASPVSHVSISCNSSNVYISDLSHNGYERQNCGRKYSSEPEINGSGIHKAGENETRMHEQIRDVRLRRMAFRVTDSLFIKLYYMVYFLSAFSSTVFVRKNDKCSSRLIADDEKLLKYIKRD